MKLKEESYRWAIRHLVKESDNDLFPRPVELLIVQEMEDDIVKELVDIELGTYKWNPARRFIVPKDDLAYRLATQLHPIDSIILGAIVYEFGNLIENKRADDDIVYSYRFIPLPDGTMYANKNAWNSFWKACQDEMVIFLDPSDDHDDDEDEKVSFVFKEEFSTVVTCDISDFYSQIYLHTIENQLIACGFPNQIKSAIKEFLLSLNENSSRGVPIGPHISHILAELSLIPVDKSLLLQGVVFYRYVDDFVFFCKDEKEARIRIQQLAEILDKEQRLTLQRQKTKIYTIGEFYEYSRKMLIQEPIYETESEILKIINKYAGGNAYTRIKLDDIEDKHLKILSEENIIKLLDEYLDKKNFDKLRWIYRRLAQMGIPHVIEYSVENFEKIIPALNDVCLYINSCAENYKSDWTMIGESVLEILDDKIIKSNPFYQISLLNLFVYNRSLNHIDKLIGIFKNSNEDIKRKILLSSIHYDSAAWIFQLKEEQGRFSSWTKRAYLIATKSLPADQKKFLNGKIREQLHDFDILERIILKWAK